MPKATGAKDRAIKLATIEAGPLVGLVIKGFWIIWAIIWELTVMGWCRDQELLSSSSSGSEPEQIGWDDLSWFRVLEATHLSIGEKCYRE